MTMLLTEKTKQEKITNEAQKKRNLFGLGLTSLIAACGAAENGATKVDHGTIPQTDLKLAPLTAHAGGTAAITPTNPDGADSRAAVDAVPAKKDLKIDIAATSGVVTSSFTATFKNGDHQTAAGADGAAQATVYTDLTTGSDLVVSSSEFGTDDGSQLTGAIYIFWDIKAGGTIANVDHADTTANYLKVAGVAIADVILSDSPEFYKDLGGKADQADMVFLSTSDAARHINILWDVTQYADEIKNNLTVESNEILQVQGISTAVPEFRKINNNEGYDMLVKGGGYTYILWDVAKYHDAKATEQAVVNLAGADAETIKATHGLLKIKYLINDIMTATTGTGDNAETGLTDIDGNGTNDLAFTDGSSTYILFGEKVANMKGGTAISHTVDLSVVAGGTFYDKAGTGRTAVTDPATTGGFFDFDLDGQGGNDIVANVGYRFIGTDQDKLGDLTKIKAAYEDAIKPDEGTPGLSEEAYWDIA